MKKIKSDTLNLCREEGSLIIQKNFKIFRSLVSQAKDFMEQGKYDSAAMFAQIAAYYAMSEHCGIYVSSELERILLTIGQEAISSSPSPQSITSLHKTPKNILHVITEVSHLGGTPRLIKRWIQKDTERSHSLCLTNQDPLTLPKIIKDAVLKSHGQIYVLNISIGGLVERAANLRKIAATVDIVVVHGWESDVVATIAFATKEQLPPVIYVNHGDHWFWLGVSTSDFVANLRESGVRLSNKRRGIETERNMLLPTPLEPAKRVLSRSEAKQCLGIDESSVLLLSIARAAKYKTIDKATFADAHVSLLKQHDRVFLIVIGPGDIEDWSEAIQQTQGRIRVLGQTEETAVFYQAADIYVDSFPFVSITSLLEAGSYSIPLVSRYHYSSDSCEIFGADMPGLSGNLIRAKDLEEYTRVLSHLIEDEDYRLRLGESTREKIAHKHWGENWQNTLENLYICASNAPRRIRTMNSIDQIYIGEPDAFAPYVYGGGYSSEWITQFLIGSMPFHERWNNWINWNKSHDYPLSFRFLLPDWLYYRLRSLKYKLKLKFFEKLTQAAEYLNRYAS
jgi:glycosyltransferase involved in cell wall biosynthesis